MKTDEHKIRIKVVCAIIEREGMILAAQRSEDMVGAYKWEFPGGKVEPGEKPEDAIVREIEEELDVLVKVKKALVPHAHDYGTRVIDLIPFICEIVKGEIVCKEHRQIAWDLPENLKELDWAAADIPVFKEYLLIGKVPN